MSTVRVPPPPAVFVGRDADVARIARGFERVAVAVIYGVAGVGKSTLASVVAASWPSTVTYARIGSDATVERLCEDALRQLGGGRDQLGDDPIAAACRALDAAGALWIVDDLHRLADRDAFVREVGGQLRAGKLIVTSRELLAFDPLSPDRLEVRLGGLDATSAQSLWAALDQLHGEVAGFEGQWSTARGNPLLLRQAHACQPVLEDYIAAAVRTLDAGERRVATALALSELALPTKLLHALAEPAVLASLVRRMIVDPAGPSSWQLHDLFRETLVREVEPGERAGLHEALADALRTAELDPVLRVREVCRHLRSVDRHDAIAAYLLEQEPTLLAEGAAGEILRGLDALPLAVRTPRVSVTLARTRARMLDLERAQRELRELVTREPSSAEGWLVLGQCALVRAELDTAESAFAALVGAPRLVQQLGVISEAILDTHRGRGDRGDQRLRDAEQRTTDRDEVGLFVLMRGFLAWIDERDADLDAMLRPNEWFAGCIAAMRANVVAPGLAATLCARLGRLDEAEAHYALAAAALRRDEDLLSRVMLAFTRAVLDVERGERVVAERALGSLGELMEARGHVVGSLMAAALRARILLVMGRRRVAHDLFAVTHARAEKLGMVSIVNQIARARGCDVVVELAGAGARGARARALQCVRAAAAGTAVDAGDGFPAEGYAVERALVRIAHAITARIRGDEVTCASELRAAANELTREGAAPEIVDEVLDVVGRARVLTARGGQLVPGEPIAELVATARVVADARTAKLHAGATVTSLRAKPALRKLFFAFARRPSAALSKDAIAEVLWGTAFDPLVHDNPLKVSITRLRGLLPPEVSLVFENEGYRLCVPDDFVYLDAPGGNPE